ncbi:MULTISPECIES: glutathione S-transferase C-terminal domain-containing protein [Streptomyces]|uniref:glutathione S-transferase C-terminal domain-containing protein n=1 Tax=Streptomyces TaxID=1883 RepID=UPI0029A945FE|nr:glutathione S-transferase C-terminal domain-containing protein [Streptomyces sp. WI03-4A]MDX2595492.1 glutathione S-transferase C-terminal domain-containing protein [Streptomyces sp. WI03-4A]
MSIASLATVPVTPCTAAPRTAARRATPAFRGRIGQDARSGHYAVPHRYRLHLSTGCADGLRLAVGHSLLGLDAVCPVVFLPALPDRPDGGHSALRPLYEASAHHWTEPALAPVLSDDWTGRIVSNHAPDILRDLDRFPRDGRLSLYPCGAESRIDAVERLCAEGVLEAARCAGRPGADPVERATAVDVLLDTLGRLERHLAGEEYAVDGRLTAADVELWVALVRLHTVHRHHLDASAARRVAGHPVLWAHVRRLTDLPAFGGHLDPDSVDSPAAGI